MRRSRKGNKAKLFFEVQNLRELKREVVAIVAIKSWKQKDVAVRIWGSVAVRTWTVWL